MIHAALWLLAFIFISGVTLTMLAFLGVSISLVSKDTWLYTGAFLVLCILGFNLHNHIQAGHRNNCIHQTTPNNYTPGTDIYNWISGHQSYYVDNCNQKFPNWSI